MKVSSNTRITLTDPSEQRRQETLALEESYQSSKMIYDLKREVLDKLDLILQRVNLEVIAEMERCGVSDFKLISMSELEEEISDLFMRLDECVVRREKSYRAQESITTSSHDSLMKENEQLRTEIQSLNGYIGELEHLTKQQSNKQQVGELKKEVEQLNSQIEKYEKMWRNVDLHPKHFDTNRLERIYAASDRVATEAIKLRQLSSQVKKQLRSFSEYIFTASAQALQKYSGLLSETRYLHLTTLNENNLLKQQILNWQYDMDHYIHEKLQVVIDGSSPKPTSI